MLNVQIEYSTGIFNIRIQNSNLVFLFKIRIQSSYSKFEFNIRIQNSNSSASAKRPTTNQPRRSREKSAHQGRKRIFFPTSPPVNSPVMMPNCSKTTTILNNDGLIWIFKLQYSNSLFKFRIQIQHSNSGFQFRIQIRHSNSAFKFRIQMQLPIFNYVSSWIWIWGVNSIFNIQSQYSKL